MTPAATEPKTSLEAALLDVQATLDELLAAANEQHAAVVARDRDRIESVTRQQERLSARLARAEARRLELLRGTSLQQAVAALPGSEAARCESLGRSIAAAVLELKRRQSNTANLLARSIELTRQTLDFLQRLVTSPSPVYTMRGLSTARHSILVDQRA
jgi:flagellar biosynthesis/type III secretory pathway chaperone